MYVLGLHWGSHSVAPFYVAHLQNKFCLLLHLLPSILCTKQFAAVTPLSTGVSVLHYHPETDEYVQIHNGNG